MCDKIKPKNSDLDELIKKCTDILKNMSQDDIDKMIAENVLDEKFEEDDSVYEDENFMLDLPERTTEYAGFDYEKVKEIADKIEEIKKDENKITILKLPEDDWSVDLIAVPKKHTKHISNVIDCLIKTKEIYPPIILESPYKPFPPEELKKLNRYDIQTEGDMMILKKQYLMENQIATELNVGDIITMINPDKTEEQSKIKSIVKIVDDPDNEVNLDSVTWGEIENNPNIYSFDLESGKRARAYQIKK